MRGKLFLVDLFVECNKYHCAVLKLILNLFNSVKESTNDHKYHHKNIAVEMNM